MDAETSSEITVLVTGGAGYIGSHACKALAQSGYRPIAYDNLSRGHAHAVKWGPLVRGDILDPVALGRAFDEFRPRAVLHFAAFAYVGESMEHPIMYYRNNVCGALNVIEAMKDSGCPLIVFSSTCATYGIPNQDLINEDHIQAPINPYGHSKHMVEQILRDSGAAHGLRSLSLRYFNAFGADPDGEIGEEHDPETHAIPLALQTAAGERETFEIYGTDYPTPDGTAIRDYIHVMDLAEAHVAALRYLETGGETISINLGTGRGHSVRQVVEAVDRVTRCTMKLREKERRAGDPPVLVADARRARSVLGWEPRYTKFDETIRTAWNWLKASSPNLKTNA